MINFRACCNTIKERLDLELKITASHGNTIEYVEQELKERKQDFKDAENQIQVLKDQMFKDSQKLAKSRKEESDMIAEI